MSEEEIDTGADTAAEQESAKEAEHDYADSPELKYVVEAALMAADEPLSLNQLKSLFLEAAAPSHADLRRAIVSLGEDYEERGIEIKQVASGFRMQVRQRYMEWISRLWQDRPPRYSRALLETLAIIAYRQPVTRGEIEHVRGVAVSTNIVRTLQERDWIHVVGHRDVPGKPALLGTTKGFLDYFNLKSLDDLPTLAEIRDIGTLAPELELVQAEQAESDDADRESDAQNEETAQQTSDEATDPSEHSAPSDAETADSPPVRLVASNDEDGPDEDAAGTEVSA